MLYFPCKRLIAHILLLGQLLTSCGNPAYLPMGRMGPYRPSSPTAIPASILCRVSHAAPRPIPLPRGARLHFHQKGSSCWAELMPESAQAINLPVRFADGFTVASLARSDPTWQAQYIHLHPDAADGLAPSFVYIGPSSPTQEGPSFATASTVDLASDFTSSSEIAPCSYTFLKAPGYKIVLEPHGDRWQAMVHDNRFPGLSRSYAASVAFEKGYCLKDFITKDATWQSRHMHLLSSNKDHPMVYMGSTGLKGGGLFNWFGLKSCTMFGCFQDVWHCVCGYKCSDNSCWQHCTKHYQSHKCVGCGTVNRCPKYYTCQTCHSTSYCSECCGCYERQRQEQIRLRSRARRVAAQRAEEEAREQQVRDQWAREIEQERIRQQQERERQERIRQQQERERQERIRQQQERERQERIRQQQERERQERIRQQQERERQEQIRQQQERERQERIRQQQERERQAVCTKLDASLASAPIAQAIALDLTTSIVKVGITQQTDQEDTFVYQSSIVQDQDPSTYLSQDSDTVFFPRCISSDSILSLYDTDNTRSQRSDQLANLPDDTPFEHKALSRCSSNDSMSSIGSRDHTRSQRSDQLANLPDDTPFEHKALSRCSSNGSIFSIGSSDNTRSQRSDQLADLLDPLPFDPAVASTSCIPDVPFPPLTRSSSNASILSNLISLFSVSDQSDASDEETTTHQEANNQITHLDAGTASDSVDPPVTAAAASSSPDTSLTRSFLENYTLHLSSEEKDSFYQSAGKFVAEKLPQVAVTTQQEIIDYFTHEGLLYPYVVQHYPPSEWILHSLLKEVVCYAKEEDPSLNRFRTQWVKLMEAYSMPDQVTLLKSLRIKRLTHNLSLLDISNIIDLVRHTGASGYAIACSESSDWLSNLKRAWLAPHLSSLTNFSALEQDHLGCALSNMHWGIHMLDAFIQSIQDEPTLDPVMELLSTIKDYQVPDALVHQTITTAPTHPEKRKAKQWVHTIVYHSLLCKISASSPEVARAIAQPLYNLLQSGCSAQLLEKTIKDHLDLINGHTSEFSAVLALLYDYQVTDRICSSVFSLLPQVAPCNWVNQIDALVASDLFESPQAYTTDELIEQIAAHSASFTPEALKSLYDGITDAYRSPSVMLQSVHDSAINKFKNKPISDWNRKEIALWANQVKASNPSITPSELIAGVQHAVKLHHGFSPRPTQLLALLTLLNPTDGMGRLAQINTGEGKSLIVAMLAAIHGLQGKKVDVVTTSTELSIPEVNKQAPFFALLSLTVAENSNMSTKLSAYKSDIVYGISGDFQADILRTEFLGKDVRGDRGFGIVIVDEVDSMLFDNRSHSVRLSEQAPGMIHLELPLVSIWEYMQRIAKQLTTIDNQTFFISEPAKRVGKTIVLDSGAPWRSCAVAVSDKRSFITEKVQNHLNKLLRDLDGAEKKEYEAFKALDSEINALEQSIANTTNAQEKEAKIASRQSLSEKLKSLPWHQRYPVLDVPVHLRNFARSQIPYWLKSALNAAYGYKEGAHYSVQDDRIVPVHYNETGVLQPNMVWSDGLTQFLQLKEGLRIDPEGVSTNFISNISFFHRYGAAIYGLTGTLGEQSTKDFLHQLYHTDTVVIPPYQHRKIINNAHSSYLCKELVPIVLSNEEKWFETVIDHALSHAQHQRGVLVICKYIGQVKYLYKQLCKRYDSAKIFPYTGEDTTFGKRTIDAGEIIIATNIAGRGTDLATSASVESHGGMYVAVTFLPESYRVEMQNVGRTARSGKKGMGQLIIYDPIRSDIDDIKKHRDAEEVVATDKSIDDAQKMLFQDRLFSDFCSLENQFFPTVRACELSQKWEDLTISWQEHATEALSPSKIEACIEKRKSDLIQISLGSLSPVEAAKLTASDQETYRMKAARQAEAERPYLASEYKKAVLNHFCDAQSHLPEELITCLKEGRVFDPKSSDVSKKYNWGLFDRKGFEEDWGFWLKGEHLDEQDLSLEKTLERFDTAFSTPSKTRALKDQLVRNPYFYVLKGNTYLVRGHLETAIDCYNRAIGMDPSFSVNALYNKAQALLLYEDNKGDRQESAYKALKKAKEIIGTISKPSLLTFSTLIAQHGGKIKTSEHVQHQLNLLNQQENYIDKACSVIEEARDKGHHVKLTTELISATLNKSEQDPSQAIREAAINGFTHLFTIERVEPVPWHSIVGLALISLTQITAGCLITACTAGLLGTGLIVEGVSDMITTVKSAIQGSFDWAAWAVQKAISLAVALVSCGMQGIKDGCRAIANTTKDLIGKTAVGATKNGVQLAAREVGSALAKGAIKECLTVAGQWCSNKLFMEDLEKNIRRQVEASITEALLNNPLVVKGLELDSKNGNNCWQNCFIQEGLSMLKEQKEHVCLTMLREISLGVAKNKITGASQFLQIAGVAKMLDELANYTNEFIEQFNTKVQSHQKDITSATQALPSSTLSTSIASATNHTSLSSNAPPIDLEESDIVVDNAEEGTTYSFKTDPKASSVQKFYQAKGRSDPRTIADAFKAQITHKLTASVKSNLVHPTIGYGVNQLTSAIFRETDSITDNLSTKVRTARDQRHVTNVLALEQYRKEKEAQKKKAKEDKNKGKKVTSSQEEGHNPALNENVQQGIERLKDDHTLDANDLALAASSVGAPIYVYDKKTGKLVDVVGDGLPGKPITLHHIQGDGCGHWEPLDTSMHVVPSGANSCLVDAVFAQLNTDQKEAIQNVNGLKQKMIETLHNHPQEANKAYEIRDKLATIAPDQLRSGGGMLANTRKTYLECKEKVDAFMKEHPKVMQAIEMGFNTLQCGTLVGCCIVNPLVFCVAVSGALVANKTCDFVIEKTGIYDPENQEKLVKFIQSIDPDIQTKEAKLFAKDLTETVEKVVRTGASAVLGSAAAKGVTLNNKGGKVAKGLDKCKDNALTGKEQLKVVGGKATKANAKGAKPNKKGEKVEKGASLPITDSQVPDIGNKLNYIFGKATGSPHSMRRSADMARQVNKIGIFDNASGKAYLKEHLAKTLNSTKGVMQNNGCTLRESLLTGPNGVIKVASIWDGNKLITVKLFG